MKIFIFLFSLLFSHQILSQSLSTDTVIQKSLITDSVSKINIDSFLKKPFDLYKFKMQVRQSHSSLYRSFPLLFKPNYQGFYYCFFLFRSKMIYRKGFKSERQNEKDGDLEIKTYKPLGKYQNEYLDPDEELIELQTSYNYIELPELAFISLDTSTLIRKLGKPKFVKENYMVYTSKNYALVFELDIYFRKVEKLRYMHLKDKLTNKNFDPKLYMAKNCWY